MTKGKHKQPKVMSEPTITQPKKAAADLVKKVRSDDSAMIRQKILDILDGANTGGATADGTGIKVPLGASLADSVPVEGGNPEEGFCFGDDALPIFSE